MNRKIMPLVAVDDPTQLNIRMLPEQKARLMRAVALENTGLTDFVLLVALREARQ